MSFNVDVTFLTVDVTDRTVCSTSAILLSIACLVSCAICLALFGIENAFDDMSVAAARSSHSVFSSICSCISDTAASCLTFVLSWWSFVMFICFMSSWFFCMFSAFCWSLLVMYCTCFGVTGCVIVFSGVVVGWGCVGSVIGVFSSTSCILFICCSNCVIF